MPRGLQVWDAQAKMVLDVTTRLTRVHGEISTGTSNGSFEIPLSSGTPFIVINDNSQIYSRRGPGVWLDGRIIRWEFSTSPFAGSPRASYKIIYGYY